MPNFILHRGDALEVLERLSDNSIEALVTDPPAGIGFMGKKWDHDRGGRDNWIAWLTAIMLQVFRVLKPGAHGLVWALPRTSHWTATALEDAGFDVRDVVMHLFGSGFPKSHDVSKAIDREAGAKGRIIGKNPAFRKSQLEHDAKWETAMRPQFKRGPATPVAREWSGWGTALKPAAEHWILVRKPLAEKTVARNVRRHRTGALNIEGCRIEAADQAVLDAAVKRMNGNKAVGWKNTSKAGIQPKSAQGRFPAHLVLSGDAPELLDAQTGTLKSGAMDGKFAGLGYHGRAKGRFYSRSADSGGASRFFYCAKASRRERGEGNKHPTVKPIALMRYLIRMITPPGGTVLDPFAGSGTTGVAAKLEGFKSILIERDASSIRTARSRVRGAE